MTIALVRADRRASDEMPAAGGRPQRAATARAARAGTERASEDENARFARLLLPYLDDAYSLARWLTGNRADAEDVVQDACLNAFRSIGTLVGGNPRAW